MERIAFKSRRARAEGLNPIAASAIKNAGTEPAIGSNQTCFCHFGECRRTQPDCNMSAISLVISNTFRHSWNFRDLLVSSAISIAPSQRFQRNIKG